MAAQRGERTSGSLWASCLTSSAVPSAESTTTIISSILQRSLSSNNCCTIGVMVAPSLMVGRMIDSRGADTGPAPMEVQGDGANPGDSKLRKVT